MDDGDMMKKGRGRYAMVRGERGGGGKGEGGKGEGRGEKDGEMKCEKKGWKGEGWGEKDEEGGMGKKDVEVPIGKELKKNEEVRRGWG